MRAYITQAASGNDPAIDAPSGAGEEAKATPGTPAALGTVTAVPGYQRIRLDWADPMDNTITKYEYRALPGNLDATEFSTAAWEDAEPVWEYTNADGDKMLAFLVDMTTGTDGADTEVSAAALAGGTHTLGIRAVNGSGDGPEVTQQGDYVGHQPHPAHQPRRQPRQRGGNAELDRRDRLRGRRVPVLPERRYERNMRPTLTGSLFPAATWKPPPTRSPALPAKRHSTSRCALYQTQTPPTPSPK